METCSITSTTGSVLLWTPIRSVASVIVLQSLVLKAINVRWRLFCRWILVVEVVCSQHFSFIWSCCLLCHSLCMLHSQIKWTEMPYSRGLIILYKNRVKFQASKALYTDYLRGIDLAVIYKQQCIFIILAAFVVVRTYLDWDAPAICKYLTKFLV